MVSVIVLAIATGLYTITGGLRAVVWTEMLQLCILLMGGIALSMATIRATGGISTIVESSKDWHLLLPASDPDFPWTMYLGGTLCISVFYCAANQFIVQRALAAKDEWHARMGIVFTDYLKFLLPLIIIVPGLVAPKLFPNLERPDLVFPTLVQNLLPQGLVGLVMAGLIAAVMGHTSGAINSCTTIATIDFYIPWKQRTQPSGRAGLSPARSDSNTDTTDAQSLKFARIFGICTIIIGVLCANLLIHHSKKPIFLYLLNAYGYFTPGIATMFLLGILWKRTTTPGALTAGILTIPLSLIFQWRFPHMPFQNRTGIVFWICMLTCAAVSLMTKAKPAQELEGLIWTKESLKLPPEDQHKMRGLRNPFIWWALITAAVLFFYIRFH
jgi:SSS family solute:Na+ symporter